MGGHRHTNRWAELLVAYPRLGRGAYAEQCACGAVRFMRQGVARTEWAEPGAPLVWRQP